MVIKKGLRLMETEQWYTVREIAAMLKVSERQVRKWAESGELRTFPIGKRGYRIMQSDFDSFVAKRRQKERQ